MDAQNRRLFIKKLIYKSCYRGCKETDLIIGRFAKDNLEKMSDVELQEFSSILDMLDTDIYDWFTGKKNVPSKYQSETLSKLINYKLY